MFGRVAVPADRGAALLPDDRARTASTGSRCVRRARPTTRGGEERPLPSISADEELAVRAPRTSRRSADGRASGLAAAAALVPRARHARSEPCGCATRRRSRSRAATLLLVLADVEFIDGDPETYTLPLAFAPGEDGEEILREHPTLAIARLEAAGDRPAGVLYDAVVDPAVTDALLDAIGGRRRFRAAGARSLRRRRRLFRQLRGPEAHLPPTGTRTEQSNSSVVLGDRLMLKLFRRLEEGINPDLEVTRFLTDRAFPNVPAVAGWVAYRVPDREPSALAILQEYVPNEGDLWTYTLDQLDDFLERAAAVGEPPGRLDTSVRALLAAAAADAPATARTMVDTFLDTAWLLGRRTGELHRAPSSDHDDPNFAPEPYAPLDQRSLYQSLRNGTRQTFQLLSRRLGSLPEAARPDVLRDPRVRGSGRGAVPGVARGAADGPADPDPRRLPRGPGALDRPRRGDHRLRGRARAPTERPAAEALGTGRCGGDDPQLPLRGVRAA